MTSADILRKPDYGDPLAHLTGRVGWTRIHAERGGTGSRRTGGEQQDKGDLKYFQNKSFS